MNYTMLLFQGRFDADIKKESMNYIYNNINSKKKWKIWLEHNDHSILNNPDHNQIVLELVKFKKNLSLNYLLLNKLLKISRLDICTF